MENPREKYLNDNMYRKLVDVMVDQIDQCNYTPSEMREAAVLASIIYEERQSLDGTYSGIGTVLPPFYYS